MKEKMERTNKISVSVVLLTIILVIQVLLVLYPLAFTISASFSDSNSLASTSIVPFKHKFSIYQYQRLFKESNYFHW